MKTLGRRDLLLGAFSRARADAAATVGAVAPDSALIAAIQPFDCMARGGQVCTVCSERCPIAGAVVFEGTRVRIAEEACTGCGICVEVCPAPTPAIVLWPRRVAADLNRSTR